MKPFKFLKNKNSTKVSHQYGSVGMSVAVFTDNETITTIVQNVTQHNNLWNGNNATYPIWWANRYTDTEYSDYREVIHTYEGTIGRFQQTYNYRNFHLCRANIKMPLHPVLNSIQYGECYYFTNDIKFSDENMWVKIKYKAFHAPI